MPTIEEQIQQRTYLKPVFDPNREGPTSTVPDDQPLQEDLVIKYDNMPIQGMVEMEVVQMVNQRKQASETFRRDKRTIWDKCWEHMLQVYDSTGKEQWQSRIFQPDTTKVVEIICSNLNSAILTPPMPAEWASKLNKYENQVLSINEITKSDLSQSDFKVHLSDFIRGLCILGTSVGKVGYDLESEDVMVKERKKPDMTSRMLAMMTGRGMPEETETYQSKRMVVKDFSKFEVCDLYKIYPEPNTTDISKKHWIIEESIITNKELVELSNHPDPFYRLKNVDSMLLSSTVGNNLETDPETQQRRWAMQQQSTALTYFEPDAKHKLDEYYGPAPLWMIDPETRNDESKKYESVNAWLWVIDGRTLVRATINPYRDGEPPYVKGEYIRVPGSWWGIGPAELMINLQINKNELVNTKGDNVNLMLNQITAILKDKVPVDCWQRLVSKPGAIWLFESIDDVRKAIFPFQFPNLVRDIYLAIQECDRAIQEVTAAVSATAGVGGDMDQAGGNTYGGQLLNTQAAATRWMNYAKVLEASCIKKIDQKIYHRIYQYKSYESVENIIGEIKAKTFEFIPPEILQQVANLNALGVMTMETKGVKLAQMDAYAKTWQGRVWLKEYDLARRQWIEMGFSDPDGVTFSEEEMKIYNNMKKQSLQLGANVGPGGAGPEVPGAETAGPPAAQMPPPGAGMRMESMPGSNDQMEGPMEQVGVPGGPV